MKTNLLLDTDSYKLAHWKAYPSEMTSMELYLESRKKDKVRFFGLQNILMNWQQNPLTQEQVEYTRELALEHFGRDDVFNYQGFTKLVSNYKGALPVRISAVPEGTLVNGSNLLVKIETTDPEFSWLGAYLEDQLMRVWYMTTVCTNSYNTKQLLLNYLNKTTPNPEVFIDFMLHDFGNRGVSSEQSASLGGLAHLVNFQGTDTLPAIQLARKNYNCNMAGFSIPAMEHSTIISWGRHRETKCYANFIQQFGQRGKPLAIVFDSYDIDYALDHIIAIELKDLVVTSGIKLMVRLDSGVPEQSILKALLSLEKTFGTTTNSKGFKVLNNVGVVQGDGINTETLSAILEMLIANKFCISNLIFGQGGGLLQAVGRDDLSFAIKPSLVKYNNNQQLSIQKTPKDDPLKASKAGELDLVNTFEHGLITIDRLTNHVPYPSVLRVVYENGALNNVDDLDTIRKRI
jgi:nicotinamide phosphoribosyltransferase